MNVLFLHMLNIVLKRWGWGPGVTVGHLRIFGHATNGGSSGWLFTIHVRAMSSWYKDRERSLFFKNCQACGAHFVHPFKLCRPWDWDQANLAPSGLSVILVRLAMVPNLTWVQFRYKAGMGIRQVFGSKGLNLDPCLWSETLTSSDQA